MSSVSQRYIELYRNLFSFGTLKKVAVIYLSLYFLYLGLNVLLFNSNQLLSYYGFLFLIFLPPLFLFMDYLLIVFFLENKPSKIFTFRRLLGKNYIQLAIYTVFQFIVFILSFALNRYDYMINLIVLLGLCFYIDVLVFYPLLTEGRYKSLIVITVKSIMVIIISLFLNLNVLSSHILYVFLPIVLLITVYEYIDRRIGSPYIKNGLLNYLRGYVSAWLLDDPRYLDSLLERESISIKTKVNYVVIPNIKIKPSVLIFPQIHFGPFRSIGSSNFPTVASSYFNINKNLNCLVFHTPSSHELDLSSNSQVFKLLEEGISFKKAKICNKISNLVTYSYGKARVHGLRLCNNILLFLEYEEMEDVPNYILPDLESYAKNNGFDILITVDCHNSLINKSLVMTKENVEELIIASKEVINILRSEEIYPFKAASIKINPPKTGINEGLGSSGIGILYLETLSSSNCIVVIDSNNLSPKLKKEVEKVLNEMGIDYAVIATTDTHEVTAIELIEGGYRILGEMEGIGDRVVEAVRLGIKVCKRNAQNAEAHIYSNDINVKVLGYDLLDRLGKASQTALKIFKTAAYSILVFLFIISSLIILI